MPEAPSPEFLSWAFWAQDHESVRDLVIAIAALVGIPFLIWREWLHHRQTDAALQQAATAQHRHQEQVKADRERRITDNFTRAAELLGSEKLATRLGAIYALERIARESQGDHWPTMETLTAYVREWSARREQEAGETESDERTAKGAGDIEPAPADIRAVLTVLGRRCLDYELETSFRSRRLDLSCSYLVLANLDPASDLSRADLSDANLSWATLNKVNLAGAKLVRANLHHAGLDKADLRGADLRGDADLSEAILRKADLRGAERLDGADLRGADLRKADLRGADLSETRGLTQLQLDVAIGDPETRIPSDVKQPRHWLEPRRG